MSRRIDIPTAAVFAPLLEPARYKGAWGGRGSGKSHFFGGLAIEDALRFPGDHGTGARILSLREVQKDLKHSAKQLMEKKLHDFGLGESDGFKVFKDVIQTPGDGVIYFQGMQDHTADSVKSLEDFHRAWVEEAQTLSARSLMLLRPTIRAEKSELWFGWNPNRPTDPVDQLLRSAAAPSNAVVVRANWSENPWFPSELEDERRDCYNKEPERYGHIWEGDYATVWEGAYFARHLTEAEQQGRIGFFGRDPLLPVYAFWDIGGTSNKSDATAIWICQFSGEERRVLDYYEVSGQPFEAHVNWLRDNSWGKAICVLPHDGKKHDTVYRVTPAGFLTEAGFVVHRVENQGAGAALKRIDAVRRIFSSVRFNRDRTEGGREALGWYHEKRDEVRGMGLGPEHDWASHAADAFGLMAVWSLTRKSESTWSKPLRRNLKGVA